MAALTPEQQAWIDDYEQAINAVRLRKQRRKLMGRHTSAGSDSSFTPAPAGNHLARCIRIIDIGTQHGEYQGEPQIKNQVILQWELVNETLEVDGVDKPFIVSKFYTNSLNEKSNMRKDFEAWRGRKFTAEELTGFDLLTVLGAPAMVSVVHNDKGKARVTGVARLPKGMSCPEPVNTPTAFWIDEWDQGKFEALSNGMKKIIMKSDEYRKRFTGQTKRLDAQKAPQTSRGEEELDDDIPF